MEKSSNKCCGNGGSSSSRFRLCCLITFSLWLYILYCNSLKPAPAGADSSVRPADRCAGRYIYVHSLPSKFNSDLIASCHDLNQWIDMCPFVVNDGLGPPINTSSSDGGGGGGAVFSETGWYATNQFTLELIFRRRIRQYECLTTDSSLASIVYVPYYPGLDIGRHLWGYNESVRDSTALELVRWLRSRPEWAAMGGRDHFLVAGRITWDFRRVTGNGDWGSRFLFMPEAKNMTCLVIESSPWHANDFAVPYPTYFHPSSAGEIVAWQERMRGMERPWLFSFAGAPRPNLTESIRGQLIEQCRSSGRCKLLKCHLGVSKCDSPSSVMQMFQSSVFCLQPQGDSYTRRSVFDAMLAGCIPVFFHPGTAYVQYVWHLPKNYSAYSVFISEDEVREGKVRVEEVLERVTGEEVRRMREEVVRMIPRLVYRVPGARIEGVKDAFDVAIERVIRRVDKMRRDLREGVPVEVEDEQNSWKYGLTGSGGKHEWDHFFNHKKN